MTQTTSGKSFCAAKVEVTSDYSDYTDISSWGAAVSVSGGERNSGDAYTFDGDTPIVTPGKRTPLEITVRYVYTEGASDAFEVLRAMYETACGGTFGLRYSPLGGDSDEFQFTTDANYTVLTSLGYPSGEAEPGDPIMNEFTVVTSDLAKSAVA